MFTQNVSVARLARNVEGDFSCDFQTPWRSRSNSCLKKEVALLYRTTFCIMTHEVFQKKKFCLVDGVGPFSK